MNLNNIHSQYNQLTINFLRTEFSQDNGSYEIDLEGDSCHKIFLITKGTGNIICDDEKISIRPGTLFHLSQGHRYKIENTGNGISFYSVTFRFWLIDHIDALKHLDFSRCIYLPKNAQDKIIKKFKNLLSDYLSRGSFGKLYCQGHLLELLISLIDLNTTLPESCKVKSNYHLNHLDKKIEDVLTYIDEHLDQKITLQDLAKVAHMSPEYLSTIFHKSQDQAPIKFLRKKRMEAAKYLLTTSLEPILNIAKSIGFKDPYHFSRCFKTYSGMSPLHYRKAAYKLKDK